MSGFAFYERSLAMYRDWELIDVLAAAADCLEPRSEQLVSMIASVRPLVMTGRRQEALDYLAAAIRPVVEGLPAGSGGEVAGIMDDLANVLSKT